MPETTFTDPDLTTFLGLDALGLTAVGQLLTSTRAIVECRMPIGFEDPFCRACGAQGVSRGTVARRLAHVPVGWRPTQLVVRVRRGLAPTPSGAIEAGGNIFAARRLNAESGCLRPRALVRLPVTP